MKKTLKIMQYLQNKKDNNLYLNSRYVDDILQTIKDAELNIDNEKLKLKAIKDYIDSLKENFDSPDFNTKNEILTSHKEHYSSLDTEALFRELKKESDNNMLAGILRESINVWNDSSEEFNDIFENTLINYFSWKAVKEYKEMIDNILNILTSEETE